MDKKKIIKKKIIKKKNGGNLFHCLIPQNQEIIKLLEHTYFNINYQKYTGQDLDANVRKFRKEQLVNFLKKKNPEDLNTIYKYIQNCTNLGELTKYKNEIEVLIYKVMNNDKGIETETTRDNDNSINLENECDFAKKTYEILIILNDNNVLKYNKEEKKITKKFNLGNETLNRQIESFAELKFRDIEDLFVN